MDLESLAIIFAGLTLGGLAKAVAGFGLPLVAVPVMATVLGVEHAVVVMVIPGTLSNLIMTWQSREHARPFENLTGVIVFGILGVAVGTWLLSWLPDRYLSLILAGVIVLYLTSRIARSDISDRALGRLRALEPAAVFVGGAVQGATGASGPVLAPFYHAQRLEPGAFVFMVSILFMVFGFLQIGSMATLDLFTPERLLQGFLSLIPVALAMWVGLWVRRRISRRSFDIAVLALLSVTGAKLLWNGVIGG